MRLLVLLSAVLLLPLTACEEGPTDPSRHVASLELVAPLTTQAWVGQPVEITVLATSAQGEPVEGATLDFVVLDNSGTFTPSRAVTDSEGLATVQLTPAEGWNRAEVRVGSAAESLSLLLHGFPPVPSPSSQRGWCWPPPGAGVSCSRACWTPAAS